MHQLDPDVRGRSKWLRASSAFHPPVPSGVCVRDGVSSAPSLAPRRGPSIYFREVSIRLPGPAERHVDENEKSERRFWDQNSGVASGRKGVGVLIGELKQRVEASKDAQASGNNLNLQLLILALGEFLGDWLATLQNLSSSIVVNVPLQ